MAPQSPSRVRVISVLGVSQILAWGSSYYLMAALAKPVADDTGWPFAWVVGGLSLGLLSAGLVSPRVGDAIQHHGGRPVLALSALVLALGLSALSIAPSLPVCLGSWIVIGVGMGAGLYNAAFATLGRLYGQRARTAIATLTLFGGFATTICWPLSALLISRFGWRGACLIYAGIHLAVVLPLYLLGLPQDRSGSLAADHLSAPTKSHPAASPIPPGSRALFVLLALAITVSAMIPTVMSVHLLTILQLRQIALVSAVALAALIGPTQVVARAIEISISRSHHPIWTMLAAAILVALGVGLLWTGLPVVPAALIFYGAGMGVASIARATVPLAVFGHGRYAALVGRIAMPTLIAQAAAPSIGALLMERFGPAVTLGALFATALVNIVLVIAVLGLQSREPVSASCDSQ